MKGGTKVGRRKRNEQGRAEPRGSRRRSLRRRMHPLRVSAPPREPSHFQEDWVADPKRPAVHPEVAGHRRAVAPLVDPSDEPSNAIALHGTRPFRPHDPSHPRGQSRAYREKRHASDVPSPSGRCRSTWQRHPAAVPPPQPPLNRHRHTENSFSHTENSSRRPEIHFRSTEIDFSTYENRFWRSNNRFWRSKSLFGVPKSISGPAKRLFDAADTLPKVRE